MGSKPKVVIRADAGSLTGFGHLVRSAALAAYLRDDFDCRIVCHNGSEKAEPFIGSVIEASGASRDNLGLPPGTSFEKFGQYFLESLCKDEIAVLDNYYYDNAYQRRVRSRSKALVSVDDMPDRRFASDVFFTSSPLRKNDFEFENDVRFFGGLEWAPLREPFLKPARYRSGREISNMVISIGGADPLGLTDVFAGVVRRVLPETFIHVIAGPSAKVQQGSDGKLRVYREVNAQKVAEIFDLCDFGIFPGSTVCAEAVSRKLPLAVGWYMDNQLNHYRHGVETGAFADLGDMRRSPDVITSDLEKIVSDYDPLKVADIDFNSYRREIIEIFKTL